MELIIILHKVALGGRVAGSWRW